MPNRKWILTSLIMTFFGIPILAQFLAAVIAMLGVGLAGIIEVCNILITPTIYLLLNIFMLALGALMLFFSGRVWADDSAPEKREIAVWRQCLFLVPALLTLGVWIIALHLADYQFRQMGAGWLADLMLPWLGVLLASLVGGEYWWLVIIPVGAHISFSLGYGWPTRYPLTGTSGYVAVILSCLSFSCLVLSPVTRLIYINSLIPASVCVKILIPGPGDPINSIINDTTAW